MADFTIKNEDTRQSIQATLKRNGSAVDLSSNVTDVKFYMRNIATDNLKVSASATLSDAANGVVQYDWSTGDVDTSGSFRAEFEVEWSSGAFETFPSDEYIYVDILEDVDE